jgi:RNA polymerase sigma-70 factor, ECF subfamily
MTKLGRALMRHEPWAARAVMERFQPSVQRLLSRMLGVGTDVEDTSQEVFLRLFARIDALEEPAALRAYLHSIAVRVACWELRRRAVRRSVLLSESGTLPEPYQPLLDDKVQTELLRLSELLSELGSVERRAFVLRRIERRTFNEIADALGVSVSTAKRRVSRVLTRVERVLARESGLTFADRSDDNNEEVAPRSYSSVA